MLENIDFLNCVVFRFYYYSASLNASILLATKNFKIDSFFVVVSSNSELMKDTEINSSENKQIFSIKVESFEQKSH